ncbi:hypothetical protein D3C78_1161000 [compost metagenome]
MVPVKLDGVADVVKCNVCWHQWGLISFYESLRYGIEYVGDFMFSYFKLVCLMLFGCV